MRKTESEICTGVHKALRDADMLGIVSSRVLTYADGREGVQIIIDFPLDVIDQMRDLQKAQEHGRAETVRGPVLSG